MTERCLGTIMASAVVTTLLGVGACSSGTRTPTRRSATTIAPRSRPTVGPGETTPPTRPTLSGRSCRPTDLALNYRSGGVGTGNDFGSIIVRNTGSTPCLLNGTATIVALDDQQRSIRLPRALGPTAVPPALYLSAKTPPWTGHANLPSGEEVALVGLLAAERDNPRTGAPCAAADETVPGYWRVQIDDANVVVANYDPDAQADGVSFPSLEACLGGFGLVGIQPWPS